VKLIVGLGNPGLRYAHTRHNAGFLAVDFILNDGDSFIMAKPGHDFKSEIFSLEQNGKKITFLKPQTFMNDSGQALRQICNFYKMDLRTDLLVIHDEVDLPFGSIRTTDSSSAAGHNGIKSIIEALATQDFHRIRIGVETRESRNDLPTDAYVLQNFTDDELKKLKEDIFPKVKIEVEKFLEKK